MSLAKRLMERKAAGLGFVREEADPADDNTVVAVTAASASPALSPARAHHLRTLARLQAQGRLVVGVDTPLSVANDEDDPRTVAAAQMRMQLDADRQRLKAIQSREKKIALKRELLPTYDAWVEGVLQAADQGVRGIQDEILINTMIWRMDVGDFIAALPLAEYVIRWSLQMPGNFRSTAPVFIVETVADAAIKAYRAGGETAKTFPAGVLPAVEELTLDEDMHDEVRAKLQRAIGLAVMAGADIDDDHDTHVRQLEALRRYARALELDDGAGVKKEIEQLQRAIAKRGAETPPADSRDASIDAHADAAGRAVMALANALETITANPPDTPPSEEAG